ncbi:class I SAM-dependent methyltransferase [uncultured Azonexus sp.]|uniref:class I SAM-dependent methyltransferase n=1 Tax=uncultured Azonexus sp. TaxID=520307 RepID=UPI002634B167|nr:class I SAM-dependent methyltransferase [uncultured Azonexus sp.]
MFDGLYRRFIDAVDRGTLAPGLQKRLWRWWYQALAMNWRDRQWTFMNYGWVPLSGEPAFALLPEDEPDRCFIGLYRYLAERVAPAGMRVLEVGSGRGGGSSYLCRYHEPSEVVGVDYSGSAVRLATRLHAGVKGLSFVEGDAERLPFEDNSFDVVINVESSHCYANMSAFLGEVRRVLKPGGRFGWVDIRGDGMIADTEAAFAGCGMLLVEAEDFTPNVAQSMLASQARKEALISRMWLGKAIAREFAATPGSTIHRALQHGGARYLGKVFRKPELPHECLT